MFNPFKILKGMFTPYVEPKKVYITPEELSSMGGGLPGSQLSGLGLGQASSAGVIGPGAGQASAAEFGESLSNPNEFRPAKKSRRKISRNARRMNGKGYGQSHTSYGHDDSGPSCSSSSSSSSDSGGGCGGGE